jgi:eukaryotic-like serine/threonine-protein kinase
MTELPAKIGKYTILEVAGRGNVGTVYVGHDPFSDKKVAIKVCNINDNSAEGAGRLFRKMFFNEAQTAGSLDNPNILKVHDAGDEEGEPYIVMEYVSGGLTLKDYCQPETLLPVERVIELSFKCAKSLDYAHRRGVVHRDIKPTNIMLNERGEVKIGDFGIAQKAQGDVTQVMGIVGSPLYMSPEQASEEELNHQTDIYSLGAVIFELLVGRPPFLPAALTRLIFQLIKEPPPDIREFRPALPEKLAGVLHKALAKDRSNRYQSCLELATDLARVAGQLQLESQEPAQISDDEKFSAVRSLHFFSGFSDSELWEVIRASRWEHSRAGDRIIDEGHYDQSFYVIVKGTVAVEKSASRISTLVSGDCFGEMAYLTKTKRTASITANEDVVLMHITASAIERASVTCQLRFNKVFLQTLIERLARTSDDYARAMV